MSTENWIWLTKIFSAVTIALTGAGLFSPRERMTVMLRDEVLALLKAQGGVPLSGEAMSQKLG